MNNKALKEMIIDKIESCKINRQGAFVRVREAEAVLDFYDELEMSLEELLAKAEEMEGATNDEL